MAADEDKPNTAKPGEERRSGRERRRPSMTIDLKAEKPDDDAAASTATRQEEAGSPKGASEGARTTRPAGEPATKGPAPRGRAAAPAQDGWTRVVFAAAVGGAIALLAVLVLQATGLMPVPGGPAARQAIETASVASGQVAALDRRVMAMEAMTTDLPSMRAEMRGIGDDLATIQESLGGLAPTSDIAAVRNELAGLKQRVESAPTAATEDELTALTNRVGRLEAIPPVGASGGAAAPALVASIDDVEARLAKLAARVDALEQKIAEMPTGPGSESAARSVALTSLRRAAAGGAPFAADVDMVATFGETSGALTQLRTFAVTGVPTTADLAAAFPPVADAILAATAGDSPNVGWWGKLVGSMRGLVSIKPAGPMPGDDPPAIVSRMQAAVDARDLAQTLAEREALPPAGKEASAHWADEATDRLSVDRLVATIVEPAPAGSE